MHEHSLSTYCMPGPGLYSRETSISKYFQVFPLQEPRAQQGGQKSDMNVLCQDSCDTAPTLAWGCHLVTFTGKRDQVVFGSCRRTPKAL